MPMIEQILPTPRLRLGDIADSLRSGLATFRAIPGVSSAYAAIFTLFGLALLSAVTAFGFSPMALPFAAGFMLVGPVLLTGFFELRRRLYGGTRPTLTAALGAFTRAPGGLWLIAALCAFLFLIWITDAGVLYSFLVGGQIESEGFAWLSALRRELGHFYLWGSLSGSVLAFMIFTVSAFSVPLIHDARANASTAIHASVRSVLGNFFVCLAWGLLLGITVVGSVMLLPLLPLVLPIMAYASHALYERAFPAIEHPADLDAGARQKDSQ